MVGSPSTTVGLAGRGITGPLGVFDGPFGLNYLIHAHSNVNWEEERLDIAEQVSIKRYNAKFQSQSSIDAAAELHRGGLREDQIAKVTLDVAKGAYDVLGGGSYGPKEECHNKEQADHNLKYLVAVALLDGDVWPEQFATERVNRADVQLLLRKVEVRSSFRYTHRIPAEMPVSLTVALVDGRELEVKRDSYEGFHSRPMTSDGVVAKFARLAEPFISDDLQNRITSAIANLENVQVADLASLLNFGGER